MSLLLENPLHLPMPSVSTTSFVGREMNYMPPAIPPETVPKAPLPPLSMVGSVNNGALPGSGLPTKSVALPGPVAYNGAFMGG